MTIINSQIKGGGTTPSGTKPITANGVYDVTDYANADVQVPTTAPAYYIELENATGVLKNSTVATTPINLTGVTSILCSLNGAYTGNQNITTPPDFSSVVTIANNNVFYNTFLNCSRLTGSVDLSSLTTVSTGAFYQCFQNTGITSVDLSGLVAINYPMFSTFYSAFSGCTSLTSVNLSGLQELKAAHAFNAAFKGCTSLTSVNLSSLKYIKDHTSSTVNAQCREMFSGCTSLTSVDLSSLEEIGTSQYCCYQMFYGCTSLTSVDLSGVTVRVSSSNNAIDGMFTGCSSLSTALLGPGFTKRDPVTVLAGLPVQNFNYEDCEYIAHSTEKATRLCYNARFASANMASFELCNVSATELFAQNTVLEEAKFPVLTRWNGTGYAAGLFAGCTNANFTDLYFPMLCVLRNAVPFDSTSFPSQLTVHFRKDQQSLIEGTTGYPFGAAACVFDQIGTITVNGINYIREGKCNETGYYAWHKASSSITVGGIVYAYDQTQITRNSTTQNAHGPVLYAWVNGLTTIYTDTLTPVVGDFIYPQWNAAKSTTQSISAVDNEYIYTVDSAEPAVNDTAYSDAQGTVLGTIDAVA